MNVEKRKTAQATTEQKPDTPPSAGGAAAAILAEATKKLGQARVDQIAAYCKSANLDLSAALKADMEFAPQKKGA